MLAAETAELVVLGQQSVDEALLGHMKPPSGLRSGWKTSTAGVLGGGGLILRVDQLQPPVPCAWLRVIDL
jgi:hypothetical protein